jgi:hypothetical protein
MKKIWGIIKVVGGLILALNVGKLIGLTIFKLIMWLEILPYLETFFGWLTWW